MSTSPTPNLTKSIQPRTQPLHTRASSAFTTYTLTVVILLAAATAWYTNGYIASLNSGIWHDEALSIFFAQSSWLELATLLSSYEANMTLYYIALKLWSALGWDESTLRLLTALTFLATLLVLYSTISRYFNHSVALVAVMFCCGHFFLARYSVEIRGYMSGAFFVVCTIHCWLRSLESNKTSWWLGYGISLVGAAYSHFLTGLIIPSLALHFLICGPKTPKYLRSTIITHSLVAIAVSPLLTFLMNKDSGQLAWVAEPTIRALLDTIFLYAGAAPQAPDFLRRTLLILFSLLLFAGSLQLLFFKHYTDRQRHFLSLCMLVTFMPVATLFIVSSYKPLYVERFLLFYVPFFMTCAAIFLESLFPGRRLIYISTLLFSALSLSAASYPDRGAEDWKGVANFIQRNCDNDTSIIFITPQAQSAFNFYTNHSTKCSYDIGPYLLNVDNYLTPTNAIPSSISKSLLENRGIWLVSAHLNGNLPALAESYRAQLSLRHNNCTKAVEFNRIRLEYYGSCDDLAKIL